MVKTQGLPGNGHGLVWSKVTNGQRQHGVATPWWEKWQPDGPVRDATEFCLVGGGECLREGIWRGLEGCTVQVRSEEELSRRREQHDQKLRSGI